MPGFKASLTYVDVDYRDRIGTLTEDYLRFLTNREVFGGVVLAHPPLDLVQFYYSQPSFTNPIAIAPNQLVAILDGQPRHLAREPPTDIDIDLGSALALEGVSLDLGLSGPLLILRLKQPSPPSLDVDII